MINQCKRIGCYNKGASRGKKQDGTTRRRGLCTRHYKESKGKKYTAPNKSKRNKPDPRLRGSEDVFGTRGGRHSSVRQILRNK